MISLLRPWSDLIQIELDWRDFATLNLSPAAPVFLEDLNLLTTIPKISTPRPLAYTAQN